MLPGGPGSLRVCAKYVQAATRAEGARYQSLGLASQQPADLSGGLLEAQKEKKIVQRACGDIAHSLCPLGASSLIRRKSEAS